MVRARRALPWSSAIGEGPVRVVWAGGLLSLVFLCLVGWAAWRAYDVYRGMRGESDHIQELVRASSLDGTLTRAARFVALTGDPAWERRYADGAAELSSILERAAALAADLGEAEAADRLRASDARLRALERLALTRARQGEAGAALDLLSSLEYNRLKEERSDVLGTIAEALRATIHTDLQWFRDRLLTVAVLGLLAFVAVLAAWLTVLALIRRHLAERDQVEAAMRADEDRRLQLMREQTARAEAEATERRISGLLESITDIFLAIDRKGRITYVNSRAAAHFGRDRRDLLGSDSRELLAGAADAAPLRDALRRAREEPTAVELEIRSWKKPGTWLDVHVYPTAEGVSVYARNITARKHAQEALRESEARFRQIADVLQDVVWLFTPDLSEALYINSAYTRLFGRPLESIYEDPGSLLDAVHPDDREQLLAGIQRALRGPASADFRIVRPDGETRWVHARALPIRDADGAVYRLAGITQDITERRQAELAIRRAKEEAERANRAKSEFLSRMSHELRTPMNAILGFGQLLEYSELEAEDRESVEQILRAGRHLLGLINEVLDLSRIEAGRITLSLEPISVLEVLRQTVGLIGMGAAERGIILTDEGWTGCDRYVLADLQRLKQVLLNLLSNAIKYNRAGGSIELFCEETPAGTLRLAVRDTGFGIPPDKMERLFTPFDRLGMEHEEVEGTGLGLALSRGLVEAMGGHLGVESEPGVGSTFWVELQLTPAPAETAEPAPAVSVSESAAPAGRTVLYIEDNLSNLRLVERILAQRPNIRLLVAMQGGLGLDLARQHRPDLVLLDLNLPDIPGVDVLQRLRQHPELRDTPVAVISADATPRRIERLLSQGARAYLTKPLDVRELLDTVDRLLKEGDERDSR